MENSQVERREMWSVIPEMDSRESWDFTLKCGIWLDLFRQNSNFKWS